MNKIIKYGVPIMVLGNLGCSIMSFILSHYTLGMNQLAVAIFMFLWYQEKEKTK